MLYVIKANNGTYFHNKGRIILFESKNQATRYLNEFIEYALLRLAQEGNPQKIMSAPIIIENNSNIMPVDFEIDKVECGTVYASDL